MVTAVRAWWRPKLVILGELLFCDSFVSLDGLFDCDLLVILGELGVGQSW